MLMLVKLSFLFQKSALIFTHTSINPVNYLFIFLSFITYFLIYSMSGLYYILIV